MARYREVADDLRHRIGSGEFSPGVRLPTITTLQQHYDVKGLNTIRQAQQLLVDDGLIETRQGVGAFVLRTEPLPREIDILAELRTARTAINQAIAALERGRRAATGVA
jgi:DNA-binding GntR family transcriptional regulator